MNHEYKSLEEYYFSRWCEELKQQGYLKSYEYEATTWELYPKQKIGWRTIRNKSYTADFTLKWIVTPTFVQSVAEDAKKAYIFHNKGVTYIDVKGSGYSGKFNNSDIEFPIIQKCLLYDKGIWIDKFLVSNKQHKGVAGFWNTFTPEEYIHTPTGKMKKLHYEPKLCGDVLQHMFNS
jgi:hypothetical protein